MSTLKDQAAAVHVLSRLVEAYPYLPGGSLHISEVYPDRVSVMVELEGLEAWRTALRVAPEDVRPGTSADVRPHLEISAPVDGVTVSVWAMGVPYAEAAGGVS
ncbi:hypothetical protein ACWEFL_02565 [Streptomyces sp. NPDC004838]